LGDLETVRWVSRFYLHSTHIFSLPFSHLKDPQPEVAEQALAFTRNLIAEASEAEISRLFDGLGEEALFEAINSAMSEISAIDMNPEGDGAVGRPEFKRQDSDSSQSSDCLEQVSGRTWETMPWLTAA
jgi:hypothetical protein